MGPIEELDLLRLDRGPDVSIYAETSRRLACDCELNRHGGVRFKSPRGNVIPETYEMTPPPTVNDPVAWIRRQVDCRRIDPKTGLTLYDGMGCDWDLAVGQLCVERRGTGLPQRGLNAAGSNVRER